MMKQQNFFKACLNRLHKIDSSRVVKPLAGQGRSSDDECCKSCGGCWNWASLSVKHEKQRIPKDVPKGHFVVYVGEYQKRFVIKIGLLNHPLFKALLDRTQEEQLVYHHSKFWIPCEEELFISIVRCASPSTSRDPYISICIC
ncbi:PREDICTED: auxin-responsive protein SAUR50-like [Ipomoea nil]|uniref:auxin-responsive protein SAUR50-like n=1 Tax=Ipomoea nil TaxID=35883 RepID=UPI000900E78C|nr:PREDICTED: auxin-responsive protein SAUR50-like [Ipomoea nil]